MEEKTQSLTVNPVTVSDLKYALSRGIGDFIKAPQYGLFFGAFYALGGLALFYGIFSAKIFWLAYPLVIGFALIGPFIASGLYEVSRRLEEGKQLSWSRILGVIWEQHRRELGWMAFVVLFIFWIWMYQARTLFAIFFGSAGFATFEGFLDAVLNTGDGLTFLLIGHVLGAVISLVLFALTVISCPLLLDRETDFVSAMLASIRTVFKSPIVMIGWGIFVVVSIMLSAIPAFAGLLIVLPVLGHATWHLYRRAVT
ncbi:MAG: DUF2189 domain-containing protein [Rhizobiaceae bacterium]